MGRKKSYNIKSHHIDDYDDVHMASKMQTNLIKNEPTQASSSNVKITEYLEKEDKKIETDKKNIAELVGFASLFRFANKIDIILILIGTLAGKYSIRIILFSSSIADTNIYLALAHGAAFPLNNIIVISLCSKDADTDFNIYLVLLVFGNLVDVFNNRSFDLCQANFTLLNSFCPENVHLTNQNFRNEYQKCTFPQENSTLLSDDFMSKVGKQSMWLVIMGCAIIVVGYFQVALWSIACERQTRRLREILFRSILSKEMAYFDTNKSGQLSTRLADDVNKVHDGIGDKVGSALQFFASFIVGLILGFVKGWKLTLVLLSVSPILVVSAAIFTRITATMTSQELKAYAKAGAIAEEVFSSIRTVFSFNGGAYESKRYEKHLRSAKISGIRKGGLNGILMGIVWSMIFCTYALGFWYGAKLVREDNFSVGGILIVFFSMITAMFGLGQAAPHLQSVAQARGAAYILWKIIDTPSKISCDSKKQIQSDDIMGDIKFSNVHFSYPSRPDVSILNGLSFMAQRGETTALVGSSGCGKSTCVQLLQRFYDPTEGSVELDGTVEIDDTPVNRYNIGWLRERIGVVSQEPILFQTTIRENIRFGKTNATQEEIEQAAKMANAHDFIKDLPQKYETLVGERGAQLSGGQKQRIAIARALIRNPRILLLDEATSALDRESERIVQDALDRASQGRTTIVIAHRLSTIVNASKIIVLNAGSVVEEGNHETLMKAKGVYYGLVEAQNIHLKTKDKDKEESYEDDEVVVDSEMNSCAQFFGDQSALNKSIEENQKSSKIGHVNESLEYSGRAPFFTVLRMNSPEWFYILLACLACICNGGAQPAFGVTLSKVIAVFQECDPNIQEKGVFIYVLFFIGIALVTLFTMFLQSFFFAISGESLTQRLRAKIFRTLLQQDIAYFDQAENNTGALCTRLATEASDVQGATGVRIGTMLQNISNLGVGIVLAFIYGWSLTLIMLAFVPFMILAGFLQTYLLTGIADKDKKVLEEAGKIAVESISNIRTVAQLTKEQYFGDEYCKKLDVCFKNSVRRAHVFGLLFGFTDAIMFFGIAALFSFGAWRVQQGAMTFENVMLILNCILFGAMSVGQTASMAPDYSKAIASSKNILSLFQRVPTIDNSSTVGNELVSKSYSTLLIHIFHRLIDYI
ncbi:unnamed protein product [Rotaria socialis]